MKSRLFVLGFGIVTAAKAFAVMGIGDVVIVASNPAQEMLWAAKELPKWIEMIDQAKEQVNKTKEMVDLIGHPEQMVGKMLTSSAPGVALALKANDLKPSSDVVDFARSSWQLYKSSDRAVKGVLSVEKEYEVFGEKMTRDPLRYLIMVSEKALRARLQEALDKKQEVDKFELSFQERALSTLSGTKSQTDIDLHQFGLNASKQRMELAAARVKQAETELQAYLGDADLEVRKKLETSLEEAEATLRGIRARAQKVESQVGRSMSSLRS